MLVPKKFLFSPFLALIFLSFIYSMQEPTCKPASNRLQITVQALLNQKSYHPLANRNFIAQLPVDSIDHIFIEMLGGKEKPDIIALNNLGETSHYFAHLVEKFKLRYSTTDIVLNKRILEQGQWHDRYGKGFSPIANTIIKTNLNHIQLIEDNKSSSLKDSPYFMLTFNSYVYGNHMGAASLGLNVGELEWLYNQHSKAYIKNSLKHPIYCCINAYTDNDNEDTNKQALVCLDFLLTKKGHANSILDKDCKLTTLHHALFKMDTQYNNPDPVPLIELLVKHKIDVNRPDSKGRTALHIATIRPLVNKQNTLRTLVQAGGDPYLPITSPSARKSKYEGQNCLDIIHKKYTDRQGQLTDQGASLLQALSAGLPAHQK